MIVIMKENATEKQMKQVIDLVTGRLNYSNKSR